MDSRRRNPLILTSDASLLDELLRLTVDAGLIADVAPDPAAARGWFDRAALVMIGTDAAVACARASLRRRPGVVLVGHAQDEDLLRQGLPDLSLAERLGADHVAILPTAEPWIVDRLRRIEDGRSGRVVAVMGGRGGAGASVLASGLAVTGARGGMETLLIDADPLGGGVDLVLGLEHRDGLRWPALSGASGRVRPSSFVSALPGRGDLAVLSWDRGTPSTATVEAMGAALDAGRRGRDLVVVDLPRRLDDPAVLALSLADRAYLVVPAELRACAAAARVAATALPYFPELALVVRQQGPTGLRVPEVADAVGLPLVGTFRFEPRVRSAVERGEPPASTGHGSLATLCGRLLADCERRRGRVAA